MSQKVSITAFMIFKIICTVVGLFLWLIGLYLFLSLKESEDLWDAIGGWLAWGGFAVLAMPVQALASVIRGAREGAIEGANTYKIVDYGSSFGITNCTFGGTFQGIVTSILANLIVGPITLGFKIIANIFTIIGCIRALRSMRSY